MSTSHNQETCRFSLPKKTLADALKILMGVAKASRKQYTLLRISVHKQYIELNIPGASQALPADTSGEGRFAVKLNYFLDLIKSDKAPMVNGVLAGEDLIVNKVKILVEPLSPVEPDTSPLSALPLNYSFMHLLELQKTNSLAGDGISAERMQKLLEEARIEVEKDIDVLYGILGKYEFKRNEVARLVYGKIGFSEEPL